MVDTNMEFRAELHCPGAPGVWVLGLWWWHEILPSFAFSGTMQHWNTSMAQEMCKFIYQAPLVDKQTLSLQRLFGSCSSDCIWTCSWNYCSAKLRKSFESKNVWDSWSYQYHLFIYSSSAAYVRSVCLNTFFISSSPGWLMNPHRCTHN